MASPPPEAALVYPALLGMMRAGWVHQMSPAADEVRWYQKRIDLVVADREERVITIEFKVSNGSRGVEQASLNRLAASSSWLAIWRASPELVRRAEAAGVGVVRLEKGFEVLAEPWPCEPRTNALRESLSASGSRVRDLLGRLRP